MKLTVIMPVFNERVTLPAILERVRQVPLAKQIIVVDDGSSDGTRDYLAGPAADGLCVLFHERNRGKGAAVRTALPFVEGDVVIIQDGDLEYDPAEYPRVIAPIVAGRTAVSYGNRFHGRVEASYRRYIWGGRLLTMLANVLYGARINDEPTCYKAFRADVLQRVRLEGDGFEFCPEVTAKVRRLGYRIAEVPISYRPRRYEQGKKIHWWDGAIAILTLLRYRLCSRRACVK